MGDYESVRVWVCECVWCEDTFKNYKHLIGIFCI